MRTGMLVDATPPLGDAACSSAASCERASRRRFREPRWCRGSTSRSDCSPCRWARRARRRRDRRETAPRRSSSLRNAFLVGGPIALLLASLGGYALAGGALRPIEAMRRRAEEISASSIDERLPVPRRGRRGRSARRTLNEMLAADRRRPRARAPVRRRREPRAPYAARALRTELELALRPRRTPEELEQRIGSAAEETDRLVRLSRTTSSCSPARSRARCRFARAARPAGRARGRCGAVRAPRRREGRTHRRRGRGRPLLGPTALRLEQALGTWSTTRSVTGGPCV